MVLASQVLGILVSWFFDCNFGYGTRKIKVNGVDVETEPLPFKDIDTVTLYINPEHQQDYYNYIVSMHPKRVVFNPGTENEELQDLLKKNDIPFMEACTLVLLSTGQY